MTDKAVFSDEEWGLLVALPRWIARATAAAEHDGKRRTRAEDEAGFVGVANGRGLGSPLVKQLANLAMDAYDDRDSVSFSDAAAGIATTMERVVTACQTMTAKADAAENAAYRRWLLNIADDVMNASRTGDRLGVGGHSVSAAERRFRASLEQALQS